MCMCGGKIIVEFDGDDYSIEADETLTYGDLLFASEVLRTMALDGIEQKQTKKPRKKKGSDE